MTFKIGVLLLLTGCSSGHYWTRPFSTEADLKREYYQCARESEDGGLSYHGSHMRKMCLEARGWTMGDTHNEPKALWKPTP